MYKLEEVDGDLSHEVLHNLNQSDPSWPALTDDHLETGWWWLLKTDPSVLVGFCGMVSMLPFPGVGYLKRAYISPDHRGRGLQLKMIEARIEKAKELGWHLLVTETTSRYAAHNFAMAGFEPCEPEQLWAGEAQYFVKHLTGGKSAPNAA